MEMLCLMLLTTATMASRPSTTVLELNEKFLDVMHEGQWLIEFYAPWCGHCKQLAPIWEQVGHELVDDDVHVGKIDCTRFTTVASAINVRGFPTIKFFKHGTAIEYDGERTKDALVDFARKAGGPSVKPVVSIADFDTVEKKHKDDVFFVVVRDDSNEQGSSELEQSLTSVADLMFTRAYFYASSESTTPRHHIIGPRPLLLVFKDGAVTAYTGLSTQTFVASWVSAARWPRFPLVAHGTLRDMGMCCNRLIVLVVSDLLKRRQSGTPVAHLHSLVDRVAREHASTTLDNAFLFAWIDGPSIANSIVLGDLSTPSIIVFNYTAYEYYVSDDAPKHMTENGLVIWLQEVASGQRTAYGGRSWTQRIKRIVYEPLLTCCLFGLPSAILGIICYSLCSADFSVEHEEVLRACSACITTLQVYPDTEDEDSAEETDHEKVE